MLQLLSPAGLWALAALSLPLAIHLWRPPPRTVRLGSLRFLESLPRRIYNLRWRERLLLAVRMALLALLALLLAGPRWQIRPARGPQRWALLDSTAALSGESLARWHARQTAGDEIHALAPGFPAAGEGKPDIAPDLWSLLREADAELPAGSLLTVFSPGRLAALRGARPALAHCRVAWVQTPDTHPAPASAGRTAGPPTPPPLGVLIVHGADRAPDARHVEAAVRAAAQVEGRAVNASFRTDDPLTGDTTSFDWVFWLSARPVPPVWTGGGANVISEEAGDATDAASWIVPGTARLWRRTFPTGPMPGAPVWTDGFGQPLLTVAREARGWHWRFFGRFEPAWTTLVRGSAFPSWLRAWLFEPAPVDPLDDRRLADPSQCRTAESAPRHGDVTLQRAGDHFVDLHGPLWMMAAALFGLERFLASRPRPQPVLPAAVLSR